MKRITEYKRFHGGMLPVLNDSNRYSAIERLAIIEDILGDEYNLGRLRELMEADRNQELQRHLKRFDIMPPKNRPEIDKAGTCYIERELDVVPVRHGKWIRLQHSGTIVCGNCGRNIRKNHGNDYADFELYCPSCGSRMDIKEENNLGSAL